VTTTGRVEVMSGLTLPCRQCAPTATFVVDGDSVRCLQCGDQRPFTRTPLHLVTGAPATGKSNVVPFLVDRLPGVAVFDTDLFGPLSHPDWEAWASSWLLLAHSLAQCAISAVLVGYGITKGNAEQLPARALLGAIRAVNLDLADDELRARLRMRPGYGDDRIERKVRAAHDLSGEADENLDVTGMTVEKIGELVSEALARIGPT
jgi:hypothetical protein